MAYRGFSGKQFSPLRELSKTRYTKIDVKTEGFEKLTYLLEGFPVAVRSSAMFGQIKAAELFKHRWKADIANGGTKYGFPPLSNSYADKKLRAGYEETPFNLTGSYYRSIKLTIRKDNVVSAEVYKGAVAPKVYGITTRSGSRKVIDYIRFVEHKRPILKRSFRAWGGKRKIAKLVSYYMENGKTSLAEYMRTGRIPSPPKNSI